MVALCDNANPGAPMNMMVWGVGKGRCGACVPADEPISLFGQALDELLKRTPPGHHWIADAESVVPCGANTNRVHVTFILTPDRKEAHG